ncbi:ATP-binding cassette domain-containing protein [bacterium]|nr:ATP-binding cassette domain-containing protein [bacterium]
MTPYDIEINSPERRLAYIRNFNIRPNAVTFLLGESGIGKTLITKALFGLLDRSGLTISINGTDYSTYAASPEVKILQRDGFFVFQEPSSHFHPLFTIGEQIREASLQETGDEREIVDHLWGSANIESLLNVYPKPYRPSGGEKQRFLLVMAFKKIKTFLRNTDAKEALFIFDEPTGSLDNYYRNRFLNFLFACYRQKPFTALIITHDYSTISQVQQQHTDLVSKVDFTEMSYENEQQVLKSFAPKTYTHWLLEQKAFPKASAEAVELLYLASGVKIFDRRLSFHRLPDDTAEVPLILKAGEWIYLKAPSGVGKTTVAKIIAGLQAAESADLRIDRIPVPAVSERSKWKQLWGRTLTMVFQHADESLNQQANVADALKGLPVQTLTPESVWKNVQAMFGNKIERKFLKQKIAHLSGGQKQRLNLLRALLLNTKIILLDEPLNGLDFQSLSSVIEQLRQKTEAGVGQLVISHNEEIFDTLVPKENIYYLKSV